MKIYKNVNVFECALERMRWLFDEFPNVEVSISGGKDSTICMELALIVAREKNRLPLKVMFIDQEAEYTETIKYMRRIAKRGLPREAGLAPEIELRWYQMPMQISNTSSKTDEWIYCWEEKEGVEWIREKEPNAITENIYGTQRFSDLFTKILKTEYKGQKACFICGIRCEESPGREVAMIQEKKYACYKWIDWGKKQFNGTNGTHYNMYPIYDWSFVDVWKAIFDNGWDYNKVYNKQFQHGNDFRTMRVSSLTHEAAITNLFKLQEIDPPMYDALAKRLQGISTTSKYTKSEYFARELPSMFASWLEYRDFLLPRLVTNEKYLKTMQDSFASHDRRYANLEEKWKLKMWKVMVNTIISNDFSMGKLKDFTSNPNLINFRKERLKNEQQAAENTADLSDSF